MLRATAEAEGRHFWFRGFRTFVTPLIGQAVSHSPDPRMLDCGCGTGANLEILTRFGHAYGVDRSAVGLHIAQAAGRDGLVCATVAAMPFRSATFDLVTSFDVLYSLDAPSERAAVAEMFRLTRPGGYALINVAALSVLRGDHSVLSHEVRRYSRRTLEQLVCGAGFTIVRLTYTNVTLFFPLLVVRLVQRWRGLAAEADAGREISIPPAPINALLTGLLRLEGVWLRYVNNPVGTSLLCLAYKPVKTPAAEPRPR